MENAHLVDRNFPLQNFHLMSKKTDHQKDHFLDFFQKRLVVIKKFHWQIEKLIQVDPKLIKNVQK